MATSSRESRRRKILERGSDRLAFITGQVQNLPPPPPHSENQIDTNHPPPPSVPIAQDPSSDLPSQIAVSPDVHDEASSSVLLKHNPSSDANQSQPSAYNGIGEGSTSHRRDRNIGSSNDSALNASGQANSLPVLSDDQMSLISTSGAVHHSETATRKHNLFAPKQISSAIDASAQARLLCSVIVAVLVVLVRLGFPLLGNRFLGSIITFRPLYLILLTNITLIMGRILFGDHGSYHEVIAEENKPSVDDNNWAEQLSKTLEVGLVAKKAIDAVFMDCSVYLIIVICGLSFT